ncbi:hypothetical protein J4H23_23485 [Vibrio alginolyticus]|uniref:DUF4760 domain-containing protein n=1 Tax=Vibrio alginolyticus TaxID=663 RepID=UPI001BD1E95F|nr:DUF4760 domain-containing protein [Vibrio alginolyticus]MBS9931029.1 hypothetical protein [Vibrio alginolyticus]
MIRIIIAILFVMSGFSLGLTYSSLAEWEKFVGPLAICISALFATVIATENIRQNKRHEVIKRTLDIINDKPPQDKELALFRDKMHRLIKSHKLWDKDINNANLDPLIADLDKGESTIARKWLVYLKNIAVGIEEGLYDKDMVEKNIGYLPMNTWRAFWPIAKNQELHFVQTFGNGKTTSLKEYELVERWVLDLSDGRDFTREDPTRSYKFETSDKNL